MKILLFLNQDTHSKTAFEILLPNLQKHNLQIILSNQVGKLDNLEKQIIELKNFEQNGVKEFFDSLNLPLVLCKNVNSAETLEEIKSFKPDLVISIRFGQIFKQDFINIPKFGVLNLHSGILPHYRGVMASFWAILNGEKQLGTTLHYIQNCGIDNGDIISFSYNAVEWNKSFVQNVNNLYEGGCDLIIKALKKIEKGEEIATIKQSILGEGRYFSYPQENDLEKFAKIMNLF